jgi:lipopolysaccharide biosynthesis glycosyltransferase
MADARKKTALVLGITGDYAFAAGCVLAAVHRHNPGLDADVIVFFDGELTENDAALLRGLGAELVPYVSDITGFPPAYEKRYSRPCLVKFECFPLLDRYETVIWLDADIAVQGDISGLFSFGPFALAEEDARFAESGTTSPVSINVDAPLPGLDMHAPNLNTGIIVFRHTLPGYMTLYERCFSWLREHARHILYLNQAAFNMLAQKLVPRGLFSRLPAELYNEHLRTTRLRKPRPSCITSAITNSGKTGCCAWHFQNGTAITGGGRNAAAPRGGAAWITGRFWTAAHSPC